MSTCRQSLYLFVCSEVCQQTFLRIFSLSLLIFCIKLEVNKCRNWQHWIFVEKGKWPKLPLKYILKFFESIFYWPLPETMNCDILFPNPMFGKFLFLIVLKCYQPILIYIYIYIYISYIYIYIYIYIVALAFQKSLGKAIIIVCIGVTAYPQKHQPLFFFAKTLKNQQIFSLLP